MTRRHEDHADVTEAETVAEVIAAGLVFFLLCFAFFAMVLTTGAAVTYP